MAWLQSVAQLCCDHKLAIRWMSPSGFPVKQFYRLSDLTRIKTTVGEQIRWTQARVERDAMSRRRQVNGISPNYIHSLDAAALVKTVNQATSKGVTSFAMIHDSFGTTAADAESLAVCLRDAYAQMFSTDLLAEFREQVQLQLGDRGTVPPVPQSGDLDVNEVRNSVYFFA
jgi:DNA-directed RNA polymerase